jgi:ABC-type phosphate transport system substrate-binding protein
MQRLNRFAKTISVAALTIGVTFAAQPVQKASAQIISGAGASSISPFSLLENWYGFGTLFDTDPDIYVGDFATYTITGSGGGRNAINNGVDPFGIPVGFYASDAQAVDNVLGFPIANVNPVDINVAFPVNVDFNGDGVQDFPVRLNADTLCLILFGEITNWNQIGGPNFPIRRVFRSDASGTTTTLDIGQAQLCAAVFGADPFNPPLDFFLSDGNGNILVPGPANVDGDDIGAPQSQGVLEAVANNVGTIGYSDLSFAVEFGFVGDNDYAGLNPTFLDLNFDGVVSGPGETQVGFTVGTGPTFVGFYRDQATAGEQDAAANLCLYITSGLDFNGDGFSNNVNESGRRFAIDILGYGEPSRPDLDPNCGTLFPGFGGGQIVFDGPSLLPGGANPIPAQ